MWPLEWIACPASCGRRVDLTQKSKQTLRESGRRDANLLPDQLYYERIPRRNKSHRLERVDNI